MATPSETLTDNFKAQQNRQAAQIAALVAVYYQQRVAVDDPQSIERWLALVIPKIIAASDQGARLAAAYYTAIRRIEAPKAPSFTPTAAVGFIDDGVRKSLLSVGPYSYTNKANEIKRLEVASPAQEQALLAEAKQVTAKKLAGAVIRHTQAGGRQTIHENTQKDQVALGWVRVTKAKPCFFCAMLASRGLNYRAYGEGAFDASDARFTGDGDAKVHDNCGCSLKPVYVKTDPLLKRTEDFADMWSRWGAGGGGSEAALRFRRGYEHWAETGEYLDWDDVA